MARTLSIPMTLFAAYTPRSIVVHVGDPVDRRAAAQRDEEHEGCLDNGIGDAEGSNPVLPVLVAAVTAVGQARGTAGRERN